MATIKTRVISVIKRDRHDTGGDIGPQGPDHSPVFSRGRPKDPPGGTSHSECVIDHVADISLMPHAVLGYAMSTGSSVETDVSFADISSLPSSVGSAGDMPRPSD